MPFCTNCGHENPEGSNFCGQCGSALIPGAAGAATPEKVPTGDTTKAMPAMVEERDTDSLTAEDEAAVNALPYGSALLIDIAYRLVATGEPGEANLRVEGAA